MKKTGNWCCIQNSFRNCCSTCCILKWSAFQFNLWLPLDQSPNTTCIENHTFYLHSGLSKDKSQYVLESWKANLIGLSRSVMAQTFMVNPLVDMEWKFGVTAASSDLKVVGNSFLQLKLVVNKGGKNENVYMELTLPQFYSFLHEMEKARTALDYFSWRSQIFYTYCTFKQIW